MLFRSLVLCAGAAPDLVWRVSPWGSHWPELPTWRLVGATTLPTRALRAVTIAAAAGREAPEPAASFPRASGGTIVRARTAQGSVAAAWDGRSLEADGIRSDGSLIVARWIEDRLRGVAAYGATAIEANGRLICSAPAPALIGATL